MVRLGYTLCLACSQFFHCFSLYVSLGLPIAGDEEIDRFMTQFFPNTSISWAYNMIHPKSRVAIAGTTILIHFLVLPTIRCFSHCVMYVDIWRYAALYAFGGFYIDDDADFNESLDKVWLAMLSHTQYIFNKNTFSSLLVLCFFLKPLRYYQFNLSTISL